MSVHTYYPPTTIPKPKTTYEKVIDIWSNNNSK